MFGGVIHRIREIFNRHYGVLPFTQLQPTLESWLRSNLWHGLMQEERKCLDQALSCLFGYHLLELSVSSHFDLSSHSRINHRFRLSPMGTQTDDSHIVLLSEFDRVPLASETIDVAILHHVLEYAERPHQLLREASRVVIPRGHVVIISFNPLSSIGLYKPFARYLGRRLHWRFHSLRLRRVIDWLRLLDFEPINVVQGFYRPPVQQPGLIKHLSWLETWGRKLHLPFGGFYLIVARKDVVPLTPVKPHWQELKTLSGLSVSKSSPRVSDFIKAR